MVWIVFVAYFVLLTRTGAAIQTQEFCGHSRSADIIHLASQFRFNIFPTILALTEAAVESNVTGKGGKIVGGMDVNDPTGGLLCWQVAIELKGLLGHVRCGGSIIGSRTILTAGHCVASNRGSFIRSPESFVVVTGARDSAFFGSNFEHGVQGCGRSYGVAKVVLHPDFEKFFLNNDLALLILDEDIDLSANCTCPMCLSDRVPAAAEWCINMGFGQETENGRDDRRPVPLKFIYQQILENMVSPLCQYSNGVIGSNFICAGGIMGTDNCYGDSGGPLVCYNPTKASFYQSGIVSYGPGTCGDGQGSRYTKVAKYLDWIVSNSNGNVII